MQHRGVAARLAPWLDDPGRAAVLSDFDGTLSAIVDDPDQARPWPGVVDTLRRLVDRYALVGVISGRSLDALRRRLGQVDGLVLAGLYGLERHPPADTALSRQAAGWRPVIEELAAAAETDAPPGARVERKGLALTLHVRQAPERLGWAEAWAAAQADRHGLRVEPGKLAIDLLPPVRMDKGDAVAELASGLRAVCFLGDDLGDLPAFNRLGALRARGVEVLRVGVLGPGSPTQLAGAVDLCVDGPPGALAVLEALVG